MKISCANSILSHVTNGNYSHPIINTCNITELLNQTGLLLLKVPKDVENLFYVLQYMKWLLVMKVLIAYSFLLNHLIWPNQHARVTSMHFSINAFLDKYQEFLWKNYWQSAWPIDNSCVKECHTIHEHLTVYLWTGKIRVISKLIHIASNLAKVTDCHYPVVKKFRWV